MRSTTEYANHSAVSHFVTFLILNARIRNRSSSRAGGVQSKTGCVHLDWDLIIIGCSREISAVSLAPDSYVTVKFDYTFFRAMKYRIRFRIN